MTRRTPGPRRGLPPASAGVAAPADKRFRRGDVKPGHPQRIGHLAWWAVRWIGPIVILCVLGLWTAQQVRASSWMTVRTITVAGNARLSVGDVETLVSGLRDARILEVDLDAYRTRLLGSRWVASASIARVLPSTIDIRITERVPLAVARLGQQLYLVDQTDVIIDEFGPKYRDFDLPIVDGLLSRPSNGTPLVDAARVRLAVAFLSALDARPDLRRRLSQIDVLTPHNVAVMFDDDTAWLYLGESRFVERLNGYLELVPTLRSRFTAIDYVDLRFDERVFVRSKGQVSDMAKTGQEN